MNQYQIHIFKNKTLYKKLKKFKSYERAKKFFDSKLKESENVFFDIKIQNTKSVKFELLFIEEKNNNQELLFKVDEFGRNVKIKTDTNDFTIIDIKPYKIPDKVFDLKQKKKISFNELILNYLKYKELKVVYLINNKIIIQRDSNYYLFSCKDENESIRFLSDLSNYCIQNDRKDIMVVLDTSIPQKKIIYKELEDLGYSRKMLYRKKTTHSERK